MHWFWYFWIISFVVCFVVDELCAMATLKKLKRIDIDFKPTKKSGVEKLVNFIKILIFAIIPFLNIIITLVVLFTCTNNEVVEKIKIKIKEDK